MVKNHPHPVLPLQIEAVNQPFGCSQQLSLPSTRCRVIWWVLVGHHQQTCHQRWACSGWFHRPSPWLIKALGWHFFRIVISQLLEPFLKTSFKNRLKSKKQNIKSWHQSNAQCGKVTTSPGTQDPTKERFKSQSTVRGMRRCVPVASSEKSSCNLMRCQSMPRHFSRFTVKRAKRPRSTAETDGLKFTKCQYLKIHLIFKHLTISSVPTKTGNSYLVSKNWISKLLLTPTKTSGTLFSGAFGGPGALLRATAGILKASFHCDADDLGGAPRTGEV